MDVERLIESTGKKRRLPVRRVTYASVLANCPTSKAEMLDALHRVRSPDATAEEVRTVLRQLTRALPRAGLHRGHATWREPPGAVLHHALWAERQSRMARMTRAETAEAVLWAMAYGPHDVWMRNRLGWAFTRGGIISHWAFLDLDSDPDEIADSLFRLDALYLARLTVPEMGADELVELVKRIRAELDLPVEHWKDENLMDVLQ